MITTDYCGLWRRNEANQIEFRYPEWYAWYLLSALTPQTLLRIEN